MSLLPQSEIRDVHGIGDDQKTLIRAYMQGAAYSWVKNRKDEWFAVRDLVGGDNYDWDRTPLQVLYDKHTALGKTHDGSAEGAAKDLGWIVKRVLEDDKRTFETKKDGLVRHYRWIGNQP